MAKSPVWLDRMVRHAGTMLGSCQCQPMPGTVAPWFMLRARRVIMIWNLFELLVANLFVDVLNAVDLVCHVVLDWPQQRTCTLPGHT